MERRLKVSESVLQKMNSFTQWHNRDHEAGGVIMGRLIKETLDVIVDEVSTPQRLDESTPTRFYRKQQDHQEIIEKVWKQSEGTCNYLGEWHTHPEDYPRPSMIDLRNWRKLVVETSQDFDELFFLILGRMAVAAYHISKSSLKISELHVDI